jgi:membrane fusion protein, adhesin transport system
MLNITNNSIKNRFEGEHFNSIKTVNEKKYSRVLLKLLAALTLLGLVTMFLPWTQNVRARGNVTTLKPEQRPQTIHNIIAGRIEKWYVKEGDFVHKGDTILFISEVKDDYFDPNLLLRTDQQLKSKELSVSSYMEKVKALDNQVDALIQTQQFRLTQAQNKLQQAKLKIVADSIDFEALKINFSIAQEQLNRMEELYKQGLKSLTDLEARRLQLQRAQALSISQESKLLSSKNDLINAKIELSSIVTDYRDKISKAESEKFTALSNMYDAEAVVTKLQNQYMNYSIRNDMYYITAPQDGYITKAIQSGIGETLKEGQEIVSIMPSDYELAVEMFIRPVDLPLMKVGKKVRIQFDGWPAVVFSGWPNLSYGTFGGKVVAVDNFISTNGRYRLLIAQDPDDNPWPSPVRPGAGADNMALLNDVPIWYEMWRQINGFPPDYYTLPEAKPIAK